MEEQPLVVKMKRRRGNLGEEVGEDGETVAKKGKIEDSLLPSASLLSLSDDVLLGVLR